MNCKLVPMDRSHLAALSQVEQECFSTPWSEHMLEEELYNDAASFLVAEDEAGRALGYAGLHVVLGEGYIDNIAVRPACRRQGVAETLLGAFVRFGKEHLSFLTLEVRPSNKPAVALYEKFGFTLAGRRRNYYENPREDALIMTLYFKEGQVLDGVE